MLQNFKNIIIILLITILLSSILLPGFEVKRGLPLIRLEEILVFFVIVGFFVYSILYPKKRIRLAKFDKIFLLLIVSILVSMGFGQLVLGIDVIGRDFFEFIKIIKYLVIFRLASSIELDKRQIKKFIKIFLFAGCVASIFAIAQFYNLFQINLFLAPQYTTSPHLRDLEVHQRVIGTFSNPNIYGIFATILIVFSVVILARSKLFRKAWPYFVVVTLAILTQIITSSRTAVGATVISFVFLFWVCAFKERKLRKIIDLSLLLAIITLSCLWFTISSPFLYRMGEGLNIAQSHTMIQRMAKWSSSVSGVKKPLIWVFGKGPSKSQELPLPPGEKQYLDNEYLLYLRRHGLIGVAIYVAMYLAVLFASWRTYLKARSREIKILSLSLVGIVIAFLVFNFTAGSFYNPQLMAMFWLLAGLVYRASGEYKPIIGNVK